MNNNTDLGRIDPIFAGFKIHGRQIITPNGYAIPIRLQQLAEHARVDLDLSERDDRLMCHNPDYRLAQTLSMNSSQKTYYVVMATVLVALYVWVSLPEVLREMTNDQRRDLPLVISLIQAVLFTSAVLIALRANQVAVDALTVNTRPWVSVSPVTKSGVSWKDGNARFDLAFDIKNYGKTPALSVSVHATVLARGSPFVADEFQAFQDDHRTSSGGWLLDEIYPGDDKPYFVNHGITLIAADIEAMQAKHVVDYGPDAAVPGFVKAILFVSLTYRATVQGSGEQYQVAHVFEVTDVSSGDRQPLTINRDVAPEHLKVLKEALHPSVVS